MARSPNPLHLPFKINPLLSPTYTSKFGWLITPKAVVKKLKIHSVYSKGNGAAFSDDTDSLFRDRVLLDSRFFCFSDVYLLLLLIN